MAFSLDCVWRLSKLRAFVLVVFFCSAAPALLWSGGAAAQVWPNKPVRMVVPFPAGVPPDIIARLFADKLSVMWGQGVIIDNRGGAGGIAGMSGFVRSPNDGYTLAFVAASTVTLTPHLFKDPQFNVDKDLAVAGRRQVGIESDAGGVQARRVMAERLAAEPVGSGASARGNVSPEKIRIAETGTA